MNASSLEVFMVKSGQGSEHAHVVKMLMAVWLKLNDL